MTELVKSVEVVKGTSGRKRNQVAKVILICVAVIALVAPFVALRPTGVWLTSGQQTYYLEKATTEAAREKGLGGRVAMAQNRGMLFVFEKPAIQCFWMKDMQFPLDIIWLDAEKRVTYVATDVSPASYPQNYCGGDATRYVLELRAGEAKRADITLGKTLEF